MGDPRKQKKKYAKPSHPWQGDRIKAERKLMNKYGLRNKKELWKMGTILRDIKWQAKSLINQTDKESEKQRELFLNRLARLGIISNINTKMEDVLDLDVTSILERRLQTIFHKKGLARSIKQARQFILHGHVMVNKNKMDISSYIVPVDEENTIEFIQLSTLASPDHPERSKGKDKRQKQKEEAKEEPEAATEEPIAEKLEEAIAGGDE